MVQAEGPSRPSSCSCSGQTDTSRKPTSRIRIQEQLSSSANWYSEALVLPNSGGQSAAFMANRHGKRVCKGCTQEQERFGFTKYTVPSADDARNIRCLWPIILVFYTLSFRWCKLLHAGFSTPKKQKAELMLWEAKQGQVLPSNGR